MQWRQAFPKTAPGQRQPPGFLNKGLELRLHWLAQPGALSAPPRNAKPRSHSERREVKALLVSIPAFSATLSRANSMRLCPTPVSRETSSEFNVHAVVRLRNKSPHGKGIDCADSVLVQKSSASFSQCRQLIIDLARDVIVAEDRLRVFTLSPSSLDHRLRPAIHPRSSA